MNMLVIAVGSYVQPLTDDALQGAEKIGPLTVNEIALALRIAKRLQAANG